MAEMVKSGAPEEGQPGFEQTLAELERLVAELESGDLPLDAALRTFEQGVRLTRDCQAALERAQQKVQVLLQRGDGVTLEDFDAGGADQRTPP
jgi:exodeoxyribonuclease VII small subunit